MHTWLIDWLECPSCHGDLEWTVTEGDEDLAAAGWVTKVVNVCRCPSHAPE